MIMAEVSFKLPVWLCLVGFFFLFIQSTDCNPDWLQSCRTCHCYWNSGKKTADCKDQSLTALPKDISSEMQVIDLSNNMIAEIRRDEFIDANLQSLHKLFMRNCTLQELSKDAFNGLDLLIELDMSHNFIRALHSGTFTGPNRLRTILMNYNEIEVLVDHLFENLPLLSRVEFKNNRIKHVGTYAFGYLPKLVAVYLEANKLKVLHKETFLQTPKLLHLSLAENPWNCTCDLQEFRDFVLANRLYTAPTSCHDPLSLHGKLWSEVPSDSFACQPRILGSVRSFIEAQSDNISLPCRVQGSPLPNVTWIYNKRPINTNDYRFKIVNYMEQNHLNTSGTTTFTSELRIYNVRVIDKGIYNCIANNRGGSAEAEFQLLVNGDQLSALSEANESVVGATSDAQSNILLIICLIITTFLLLLVIAVLIICWYCKRLRAYQKDSTIASNSGSKTDRTHNASMLEGSVIMEMQKSLLTDVNPVEKPPRRSDFEVDGSDDKSDYKKNLLDTPKFGNQHHQDDETHSIALSDTIVPHKNRRGYVDENYGSSLPPDLLAFPGRIADTSPSMQSAHSLVPDQSIYGIRSPSIASPVYAHVTPHSVYGKRAIDANSLSGFMTLQHPKTRNLSHIAVANNCQQPQQYSPFVPAPVIYSPIPNASGVIKHGYMTIPRKPRIPSWAPSCASVTQPILVSEFQSPISPNPSETATTITLESQTEPVYDNLGLRTTIGGNSTLNLYKAHHGEPSVRYTMRDRPLPATPSLKSEGLNDTNTGTIKHSSNEPSSSSTGTKLYEPIQEITDHELSTQPLYDAERNHAEPVKTANTTSDNAEYFRYNELPKLAKTPPRPPPKPKKKMSVIATHARQGSSGQLFDDEGEDGTEV